MDLAEDAADIGDACVTLCVHAGIAAADAITAHRVGLHHSGDNHAEAVALLRTVRRTAPTSPCTCRRCSA